MSTRVIYEPKGRAGEYALLALNHYKGCSHGCRYCYAAKMAKRFSHRGHRVHGENKGRTTQERSRRSGGQEEKQSFRLPEARYNVVERLKADAEKLYGTDKRVLLSFMTDPYQPLDDRCNLTRRCLQILSAARIPFEILTKGGLRAIKDFDLYSERDVFSCTLTFMNGSESAYFEPGAAPFDHRVKALEAAKNKGISTAVSLEPVLQPSVTLEIIKRCAEFVDLFRVGKINHAPVLEDEIDWRLFGRRAVELLERLGKRYYIKKDLAEYMGGIAFRNTEFRRAVASCEL